MTLIEFIKMLLLVVLPTLLIVTAAALIISSLPISEMAQGIIAIIFAIVYSYPLLKWCEFLSDKNWL